MAVTCPEFVAYRERYPHVYDWQWEILAKYEDLLKCCQHCHEQCKGEHRERRSA